MAVASVTEEKLENPNQSPGGKGRTHNFRSRNVDAGVGGGK